MSEQLNPAEDAFNLIVDKHIDGMVDHDDPNCPQDDTCDCENVAQIEAACRAVFKAIRAPSPDLDRLRSVAPIPPAAEIAAMREVVEAARKALNYIENCESELDMTIESGARLRIAFARLDAARKGGAT